MNTITITAGRTTYVITGLNPPTAEELPWRSDECDAFVVILNPDLLTDEVAQKISSSLVRLRTGWVETVGARSEYLHDLVDSASVEAGRQARVGDGNPMTAWYDYMHDMHVIIDWLRAGGLGGTDNKLVVVIGAEDQATALATQLEEACGADME